jgi:arylsulfatase A-like enzyme
MIRVPGLPGRRVDSPVEAVDLMPTVFEAAGIAPPYPFQGRRLLGALGRPERQDAERVRIAEMPEAVALQSGPWKAVFPRAGNAAPSLHQLAQDPEERTDLAAAHPEILARLWTAYASMKDNSRELSARFVPKAQAPLDDGLKEELKALGYVN